jgi:hypothetical protein
MFMGFVAWALGAYCLFNGDKPGGYFFLLTSAVWFAEDRIIKSIEGNNK